MTVGELIAWLDNLSADAAVKAWVTSEGQDGFDVALEEPEDRSYPVVLYIEAQHD